MRILIVEDDHRVARGLMTALTRAGFTASRVATAEDALAAPAADVVLLDLGLPDGDGIEVCRRLRRRHTCGVIMVTARAEQRDRVLGLRMGADDYVVKPFGMDELLARIEAVARRTRADRSRPASQGLLELPGLVLDLDNRRALAGQRDLALTPKEFELLHLLVAHRDRVCSRQMILDQIWHAAYETPSRTLDVHVAALRTKLGAEPLARIETLRGVGYRLDGAVLRRLLGGLVVMVLLFAVVVSLPLAGIVADRATQTVYLDRLADADRFATLADRGLRDGRTGSVADQLRRYFAVYGIRAWLLRVDGSTIVSADGADPPPTVLAAGDVGLAERGVQPDPPPPVSPTGTGGLLVAVPIGTGAEAIGAIVTLSPLADLRRQIALRWGVLAAIAALITVGLAGGAVPFSRWLLRPVARLDEAASEIAAGRLESRVGLAAGPPELRRLAGSFDRMATVVERTLLRQQQFVGDASHQLRTPLTSLRLALDNLGAQLPPEPDDPARAEHAEAVDEARAMGRMLDGLLALTRLGSEPGVVQNVAEVLDDAQIGWQARCAAAGLQLTVERRGELRVTAPPGGLRHLLDELVENACRLSGGSTLHVTAERRDGPAGAGAFVVITVRDNGRGLDPVERAAATRRFWRATDQQNTAGSGLGLAIVAELMAAVDGAAELRDAGPGLAVALTLPAVE